MKAIECLLYSQDKFKTVSDAWSHTIHFLSYPKYYPKEYVPKISAKQFPIEIANAKNFVEEIEELFEEFIKYKFICFNDKENSIFMDLTIEDGIRQIHYLNND